MNHLLIGLGGTGGRTLKAFRKLMYQTFRDAEPDGTVIDYLFVDSDPKSFADDDPSWTILGRSVQLPKRSQMLIAQANLLNIVGDLNAHPNLKPWLGDREAWGEILSSLNVDAAGGQKRRLGRFLFAMSARRYRDAITTIVQDMQTKGDRSTDVVFHIFCGLAGGTGAGAIADAVAQLRSMYPDQRTKKIMLYAYLPDLNPPGRWDTGNYHANAYASLLELNAMAAGTWAPFDVVNGGGPVRNPGGFWFNGAYVYTDENDQGFRASIDKDLPDILADLMFHKTIVARRVNWDGLVRMENSENGDASPETSAGSKQGQRSVRFLSFGIRRLAFPEERIREYLTYDFAVQAFRQLAYNNWQDGVGFLERARPRADAEFVADRKQQEEWRITDAHLRLERPIIDSEGSKRWRDYAQEWEEWRINYRSLAQSAEKLKWLNELSKLFNNTWSTNFRNAGVAQFFETANRDRKNLAAAIRDRIERSLFEAWRNGNRSIAECGRVVEQTIADLTDRIVKIDDYVAKREATVADYQGQFAELERRWDRLRILPGERERELDKASYLLRDIFAARTLGEAGRSAKRLIEELTAQLVELKASVDRAETAVGTAAEQALKTVQARSPEAAKADGRSSYVTTIDDPQQVEATRRRLTLNEEEQRTQTATLRGRIIQSLGQQPTFASFTRRFGEADIRNIIVATSEENVASAHQRLVTERTERVIGVSVLDKLRDSWGDNADRLNREASSLARSAGRFLLFDETEVNKHFDGRTITPRAVESFAVMMPNPAEHKEFVVQLKTAFKNARSGGDVDFITTDDKANEITVVTLVNLFPLRFARLVRGLKDKYERRMAQAPTRVALEVHTEGDGSQFPDLFVPERGAVVQKLRPLLLLAEATGVATRAKSAATGREQLVLIRKDADGFDLEPVVLGADALDALENATERSYFDLRDALAARLIAGAYVTDEQRTTVRDAMIAGVDLIEARRGNDASDPEAIAWNAAAREAMKILRREVEL